MTIWVVGDWHLGHDKSLTWLDSDGNRCRPFDSIELYHETLIKNHNQLVRPEDRVYVLGDAAIKKSALSLVKEFNGKKTLIAGNHDIFDTKEYLLAGFKNVRGVRVLPDLHVILSHIPVHPDCLFNRTCGKMTNFHGHLHGGRIMAEDWSDDLCYKCVSVEQTSYHPFRLD